jgi:tRNA(Ile)-lysidine synthase
MTKFVVAVSGGVDSVVLLDMLVNGRISLPSANGTGALRRLQGEERFLEFTSKKPAEGLAPPEFIIAHFDHGIRPDSADDAKFVGQLAEKYGLKFETKREELGAKASEELARERRYAFLRNVAKKHKAKIMTAHHADDVVETIAINLIRGTGWRGLAVLDSPGIERPLLDTAKSELLKYAKENKLEWREDPTNEDTKYLRNNVRKKLAGLDVQTRQTLLLYRVRQRFLRKEVDNEALRIIGASPYGRHLFISVDDRIACELLRAVLMLEAGRSVTRPQLLRALTAIKVLHGGKRYEVAERITLAFTKTHFIVEIHG